MQPLTGITPVPLGRSQEGQQEVFSVEDIPDELVVGLDGFLAVLVSLQLQDTGVSDVKGFYRFLSGSLPELFF